MNSKDNEEESKEENNIPTKKKGETEDKEIALNLEDNKENEKIRQLNILETEEEEIKKKKPLCKCQCTIF